MVIKLTTESIRTLALFERITKIPAKDCVIMENSVYFLVDPQLVGLAIGRNGSNIKEIKRILNKNVKVFGYSKNPEELIRNLIPHVKNIEINNSSITVTVPSKYKTVVIGKGGENIKALREIVKRHLNISKLRLR